jgi:hypothetical protein
MFGGSRFGRLVAGAALVLALGSRPVLAGDRVAELTSNLSSSSENTRLSAVLSLARLGDKRAIKPLITALQDPNAKVRAIAATALGKLGQKAALAPLKALATDDTDETVRKVAREAANSVARANHLENEISAAPNSEPAPPPSASSSAATPQPQPTQARMTGFGRSPHAVENHPDLYVTLKGTNDDSPGNTDKATRKLNADVLAVALKDELRTAHQVTMIQDDAERWGLEARQIDVSVTKVEVAQNGNYMEVGVDLRLAISDNTGKMMSFLSGGAKVQVPLSKYRPQYLGNIRKEAIQGAVQGIMDKLLAHLRQMTTT